jgi:very-short-patch-repair endonuclease
MANEIARELRRNRTGAERERWSRLRQLKEAGFRFRQQTPIDRFVVDFVCLGKRLIVELDGATHGTTEERRKDAERERYLVSQGFRVMRFWNDDVLNNLDGVMDSIVHELNTPTPTPPCKGEGPSTGKQRVKESTDE